MTTKIAEFAKTHFGIELTDAQQQYIAMYATEQRPILMGRRLSGITTANKVILAYLQDGLKAAK